jgi:hypothetical protein
MQNEVYRDIFHIFPLSASKSLEIQIIFHFPTRIRRAQQKGEQAPREYGDIRKKTRSC